MRRRIMLFGGLLMVGVLFGQMALNATGVAGVSLEKVTQTPPATQAISKPAVVNEAALNQIRAKAQKMRRPLPEQLPVADTNSGEETGGTLNAPAAPKPASEPGYEAPGFKSGRTLFAGAPHPAETATLQAPRRSLTAREAEAIKAAQNANDIASPSVGIIETQPASIETEFSQPPAVSENDPSDSNPAGQAQSRSGSTGSLDNTDADTWGYAYKDNVSPDTATYSWIELQNAPGREYVQWAPEHNSQSSLNLYLGFTFPFYFDNWDSVQVATNGFLYFDNRTCYFWDSGSNYGLPTPNDNDPCIFPFNDRLELNRNSQTQNQVMFCRFPGYAVIQWDAIGVYNAACGPGLPNDSLNLLTFETILYNTGKIKFQYKYIQLCAAGDTSYTIGIQSGGNVGDPALAYAACPLPFPYVFTGHRVQNGRAIWFYPVSWTHNFTVRTLDQPAPDPVDTVRYAPGAQEWVQATIYNAGTTSEACPIKYQFNGGPVITESTGMLPSRSQITHSFATRITMPATPGSYQLSVWSDLATDEDRGGDTLRTIVKVAQGMDCGNEIILTGASGDQTFDNTNMGDFTPGNSCAPNSYVDMVFKKTVDPGHSISMWVHNITWGALGHYFPNITMSMAWGGQCPGSNSIDCFYAATDPFKQHKIVWTNTTGIQQTVYTVVGNYRANGNQAHGPFDLGWEDQLCTAVNVPLTEGFEGLSVPWLRSCWSQKNVNTDSMIWESYGSNARTGSLCAQMRGTNGNDWLFSPGVNLVQAHDYYLQYYRRTQTTNFYDSIEVKAGLFPEPSAMNISVCALDTMRSLTYVQKSGGFTCPTTGVYYVGWHSMNRANNGFRTYIDDILFDASGACSAPAITASAAVGTDSVTLTTSLQGGSGGNPQYQWYTGVGISQVNRIAGADQATLKVYSSGIYTCRVYALDSVNCMNWDSALATVYDCTTPVNTPISETFESTTGTALPTCWFATDLNTDNRTWQSDNSAPHSGQRNGYVRYSGAASEPNDWLFSRRLNLLVGHTYHIDYWFAQSLPSSNYFDMLEVKAGSAPVPVSMSHEVDPAFSFSDVQNYMEHQSTFTPLASGVYYIGWHYLGLANQGGVVLDDIEIYDAGECIAPSLTVNSVAAGDSATLTAAVIGGSGGVTQYQWYHGGSCATGQIISGATLSSYTTRTNGVFSCKAWKGNSATCSVCDSATATVLSCASPLSLSQPMYESFDETSDPAPLPGCWSHVDLDQSEAAWTTSDSYALSGRSAWIGALPGAGALDDYLFSRGFSCTVNDTVFVDYWYRAAHDVVSATETMEVKAGTAQDPMSTPITVDPEFDFNDITYNRHVRMFVAPTTGTYFVSWHAIGSQPSARGIAVDDVRIYRSGTCTPPSAVDVHAVANPAFVTLTCSVTGGFGGIPQYQWYTGVSCGLGSEIVGANTSTFTTFVSGTYSCKAWFGNPATCGRCDSALATVMPDPCLPGATVTPSFFENFGSSSGLPTCWAEQDLNDDGFAWTTTAAGSHTAPRCAYLNTQTQPANDWLFAEPVQLVSGTTYRVEYWRRSTVTANDQTLSLAVGTHPFNSAMTTILLGAYSFNDTAYVSDYATFAPSTNGSYYFGIHCTTPTTGGGVDLDDFVVYQAGTCGAPTTVSVTSATGADSAILSCTADGGWGATDYSYQWFTGSDCSTGNAISGATGQTYRATVSGTYSCKAYLLNASTCGTCGSGTATVIPCASSPVITWPYSESFEGNTIPDLPDCWRTQDVNADSRTWQKSGIAPHFGTKTAYCPFTLDGTGPADDWMFSVPMHFVAGQTMVVDYWYRQYQNAREPGETIAVYAGLAPRASSMSNVVDASFTFSNSSWAEHTGNFSVSVTGDYYIGWHCTSGAYRNGVLLDDIMVYPSNFCAAPTVHVSDVTWPASVTLTATAYGGLGQAIQYQWYRGGLPLPANIITGATTAQYTTTITGTNTFCCKAWRSDATTCASSDSAHANVLVPAPGDLCTNPIVLTPPASGASTEVSGTTTGFYPTCTAICGTGISNGADVFYSYTLAGMPESGCRRIAMSLVSTDAFLTIYNGQANCCGTPVLCNDDDAQFANILEWDVPGQHAGGLNSYISAELEPGTYILRVGFAGPTTGAYTLTVYNNGPCFTPCDSASHLTSYFSMSSPSNVWLHFNAPSIGTYKIYSTTNKNSDGDPRGGDPNWSLAGTVQATSPGTVTWTDPATASGYMSYTVIHDCPILGRCCYGDDGIHGPLCTDNSEAQCLALSGSWNHNLRCSNSFCTWDQATPGEDWNSATMLRGPLPIVAQGSTLGHLDDIDWYVPFPNPSPTPECWQVDFVGTTNAQGPDVMWQWVVPFDGNYQFSMCPATWDAALILFNYTTPAMPTVDDVVCGNDDGGPARCALQPMAPVLDNLPLVEGQHILIDVDGFGPTDAGDFTLTITLAQ
jgi:hypothetical protein